MIIGLDIGSSAVKTIGYNNGEILFTKMTERKGCDIDAEIERVLSENHSSLSEVELIAATGVGAESYLKDSSLAPSQLVSEIEATGDGGTWLAGINNAIIASVGTGTALILAKDGEYSHVGGSGVGSGTVRGLAKKLIGMTDLPEYFDYAEKGDLSRVDILIGDLFAGTDTLPVDLTASNLAKCRDDASDSDWAAAVINMVLEVAGSHAALACAGYQVNTVIITGGLSCTKIAQECYKKFDRLYRPTYIIPPHSDCATAIGAARRAANGK